MSRIIKSPKTVDPQDNRRKARRRPILDTFSLFVVVSTKNILRLKINDLSELGIGFNFDIEGEEQVPVKVGDPLELQLYLNQTLHIPLQVKVARVEDSEKVRRVGAEYLDRNSPPYQALVAFLEMLDRVVDVGLIDTPSQPEVPSETS